MNGVGIEKQSKGKESLMREWTLEDVEQAAATSPHSFFIATRKVRESQSPGSSVRLHFILENPGANEPRAERMWVEVKERLPNGEYDGYLKNKPEFLKTLQRGDVIRFSACHIARISLKPSDPGWIECGEQKAIVSEMVFAPKEIVRFAYREKAINPQDSGWRLLTSNESQDYLDNSKNIRRCDVYWLCDYDRTLEAIIRSPIGSVFERKNKKARWKKVKDWKPSED